jgi:RNA-splicing ligase RtcB
MEKKIGDLIRNLRPDDDSYMLVGAIGATVDSVIPTKGAIIPAAVGVDIGCGMMAVQTDLNARELPDSLRRIRGAIEKAVPHGRTNSGGRGNVGAWRVPTNTAPGSTTDN